MSIAQTQAKLKWEAACERLRFALDNSTSTQSGGERPDPREAFQLVQAALDELKQACLPPPVASDD